MGLLGGTTGLLVRKLLERDDVLDDLRAMVIDAPAGPGRVVLLSGEAGVGKSAVAERVGLEAGELRIWAGGCEQLFAARPLGPLVDIASGAGGQLAAVVGHGERPHEVLPVLLDELRATPTLMLIEDAQWADEATLDLLALVGRRIAGTRSVLLITFRDDELSIDHPLRQLLGSLATAQLASAGSVWIR